VKKKILAIVLASSLVLSLGLVFAGPVGAAPGSTNMLTNNPGAETGNTTGWAITGNVAAINEIAESTSRPETVKPCEGSWFFTMGLGPGPSSMSQSFDLSTLPGVPVSFDAGGCVQTEDYWGDVPDDKGRLTVEFFDNSMAYLGTFTIDPLEHPVLGTSMNGRDYLQFSLTGTVPTNAKYASYTLDGYLLQGSYINVFYDGLYFEVTYNEPPDCTGAYANPGCLWPPNHKFVDISIMGVTDPDGDPVTITITGITSDEPTATDKGSGGAKHAPDAMGVGTDTASVRAERSGRGDGRVYVISFRATDDSGNECNGTVMVNVPHDQSDKSCPTGNSGQQYDATQIN